MTHKVILTVLLLCLLFVTSSMQSVATTPSHPSQGPYINGLSTGQSFGELPLYFVENAGQMDKRVLYFEKGKDHSLFVTREGVSWTFEQQISRSVGLDSNKREGQIEKIQKESIRLTALNSNPKVQVVAMNPQEAKFHYFIGRDPSQWKQNVPTYGSILFKEIYPGIDMKFYGKNQELEYDLIVKPGSSASQIHLSYEGIHGLKLTEKGDLAVELQRGSIIQKAPKIYQEIDGRMSPVQGNFILERTKWHRSKTNSQFAFSFQLGPYDKRYPLIIDPVLRYSTYLGGSGEDEASSVAVDNLGQAYVTGFAGSTDFPSTVGAFDTDPDLDVYITKFNAAGSGLIFSTFLGGSGGEGGSDIALDPLGNVVIVGDTRSTDFPITSGAMDSTCTGSCSTTGDVFVTILRADGSDLLFSTYLGGDKEERAGGVAVDPQSAICVTGTTSSFDFPTTPGAIKTLCDSATCGPSEVFVTKINDTHTAFVYSTFLGGSLAEDGTGITLDAAGNSVVAGSTSSLNFPVTSGVFDTTPNGDFDAFVTKILPDGSGLASSTLLGGTGREKTKDVTIETSGNIVVVGETMSSNFPVTAGAFDTSPCPGPFCQQVFVTSLTPQLSCLTYSTYLGSNGDEVSGVAADTTGLIVWVAGISVSADFPVTPDAMDSSSDLAGDAFVSRIRLINFTSSLIYSTFLGGSSGDFSGGAIEGSGIAVDSNNSVYITGDTNSADFPVTGGAFDLTYNLEKDGFVTKIAPCWFCHHFEDFALDRDWTYTANSWSKRSGNLVGTEVSDKIFARAIASPAFPGCTICNVHAVLTTAGGKKGEVQLLGWFGDENNHVELEMNEEKDNWTLRQVALGETVKQKHASLVIAPNKDYQAKIEFDGNIFRVFIDGTLVITMPKDARTNPNGTVGFQVKGTTGTFDEIFVN